jgi:hypothetical protein
VAPRLDYSSLVPVTADALLHLCASAPLRLCPLDWLPVSGKPGAVSPPPGPRGPPPIQRLRVTLPALLPTHVFYKWGSMSARTLFISARAS